MKLRSLHDLFEHELRDVYDAERQLVKALRKMAKAASSSELRSAFENHLTETEGQVSRLETVFAECDLKPKGRSCAAMKGLIEEGKTIIASSADEATGDAGLIAAAQKAEHYEIASYGCLSTWARQLGYGEAARLLDETLAEEKNADAKLSQLAEANINREANPNGSAAPATADDAAEHDDREYRRAGEEESQRPGAETRSRELLPT